MLKSFRWKTDAGVCHGDGDNVVGGFGLDNLTVSYGNSLTSLGYNLLDKKADLTNPHASDLMGVKPHLAPLAFYGGLVQTQPPLAISPVIDAGDTVSFWFNLYIPIGMAPIPNPVDRLYSI